MAVDKKVTELPVLSGNILGTDIGLAVRGDTDYQFNFTALLNYIGANLPVGSVITFGTDTPPNTSGKNGDLLIKPASGQFWQKVGGTWVLQYTVPAPGSGTTVLYGTVAPNNGTGNNGDTYIATTTGVFYKKTAGAWSQVFSMATGPAGPQGPAGTNGTNGTNGNTVRNGTTPPSNDLGVNGDFYINTSSKFIYGPKAAGVWPAGTSLINNAPNFSQGYNYNVSNAQFVYDDVNYTLTYFLTSADQVNFPYSTDDIVILKPILAEKLTSNKYKYHYEYSPTIEDDGMNYISVMFEGVMDDLLNNTKIILF